MDLKIKRIKKIIAVKWIVVEVLWAIHHLIKTKSLN